MISFSQSIRKFSFLLFISLGVVFIGHFAYIYTFVPDYTIESIAITYGVNYLLAVVITYTLFRLREKYLHTLGFLFMGGSMLKFLIFFLALQPIYKTDGEISTLEFGYFFIPYAICLAFETVFIGRILNESDE